ncbi:MAG: topoisomerase type zn finger domain protein [Phycisphaerales bacterium]|nr:topoisomerase type zn finger domain protein [Phycisphaerales bacterium]
MEPKGCLFGFLANLFGSGRASPRAGVPKVMVNKKFVSAAEGDFFRVLRAVVGTRGHVLAQVSLRQLLWFPNQQGLQGWRNKVAQKSIDFVVCDVATLRPLVAIELMESSHTRPQRQTRDDEVHAILTAAGLEWFCVNTSRNYDTRELEAALAPHLKPPAAPRAR